MKSPSAAEGRGSCYPHHVLGMCCLWDAARTGVFISQKRKEIHVSVNE